MKINGLRGKWCTPSPKPLSRGACWELPYANWKGGEYRAALAGLLGAAGGANERRLAGELAAVYGNPAGILLLNAGRTAIKLALAAFRAARPDRRRVLVPAYVCPSAVEAVIDSGLEPVAVAVDTNLNMDPEALEARLEQDVLAVLAVHAYGCPAGIERIEALCRQRDVCLLDDAAQVLGVRREGRPLGTFGDVGILSFAQSKTLVTGVRGSGGVLIVNHEEWLEPLRAAWERLPPARGRRRQLLHFLAHYQFEPVLGLLGYYAQRLRERLGIGGGGDWFRPARISAMEAAIARRQLARLDELLAERRRIAGEYGRALAGLEGVCMAQRADGAGILTRILVRFADRDDAARVGRCLRGVGVRTRSPYPPPRIAGLSDQERELPAHLLELPSPASMPAGDIRRVCARLRDCLAGRIGMENRPAQESVGLKGIEAKKRDSEDDFS